MTIEEARDLIDTAIAADMGKNAFALPPASVLCAIGVMNLHKAYYDTGLAIHPEVKKLLKQFPQGCIASVVKFIVDQRSERGEYKKSTLLKMYNLVE